MKLIDLTGEVFGRLRVVSRDFQATKHLKWLCVCVCGTHCSVARTSLRAGVTKSCGCLQAETVSARRRDHGLSRTREYTCWKNMRDRCLNPKNAGYHNYGGRGVKVASSWADFTVFLADMGPCPAGHSLDRRDNELGYSAENCRWLKRGLQQLNTRRNNNITYNGITKTLEEWSEVTGLNRATLRYRLINWESKEAAMTEPARRGLTLNNRKA